jgi:hypothetical protein
MKLIINISDESYDKALNGIINCKECFDAIVYGKPIPDNATNGDVIKTIFDNDKVSEFMGYVRIMARVGNWFNDGIVAEFDKDWWNAPYQKGGK